MTRSRRNHRSIISLYPKGSRFEAGRLVTGQETYTYRIPTLELPCGPACLCFQCACIREATGHRPLDPAPELTAIAERILARAAERDEERIRLAPGALPVGPTLTVSAGVGALFGVTLFWLLLS